MIRERDILELLAEHPHPCVSLYMPTHRTAPDTEQDRIRFKNLLRLIESELIGTGMRTADVDALLGNAEKLRHDSLFWRRQSDGLACFLAPGYFRAERVPLHLEPEHRIAERFYIRPLLPLLAAHQRFFILALSQESAELYEATPLSIGEIPLTPLPGGTRSLLPDRRVDAALQYHTVGPSSRSGATTPVYHGHGLAAEKDDADILRFFRAVDRAVYEVLKGEEGPLVLACVGFLASLYGSVNSYRHIMRTKIPGSPDGWTQLELHARGYEIARPQLDQARREARQRYEDASSTPLTSNRIEQIVLAADDGRVDTLFTAKRIDCAGSYDPEQRLVKLDRKRGCDDLIDVAAGRTLQNGGTVIVTEQVPGHTPLAATFRYALPSDVVGNSK